jgi:RHS repeat-associated protein
LSRLSIVAQSAGGTRAYTYDAAGNVVTDSRGAGYGYTYDAAGRMVTMSINGVLQGSYRYDFAGRQAVRTLTSPKAVTIHSVFDSNGRRIAEYNEGTGAPVREYVWLGWSPIAVIEGGVVSFVRTDHIGRPVFATNAAGTKVWTASYLPFGSIRTTTGTPITARFPGQWFQSESGLHQNWMRDYDPATGRYLQADPLGLVDGASVYGYAYQSPLRYMDHRGEFSILGGAAGAIGSFAIQYSINLVYGQMGWSDAAKCVDAVAVVNGFIIGGFGNGALGLTVKRRFGEAFVWFGIGNQINKAAPDVNIGSMIGQTCDCKLPNLPDWVKFLRDSIL